MSEVLPAVQLPGASARRATALEMFGASHITPSYRRMAHVLWTDSMTRETLVFDQRIDLRGFSAGSFAGLSTLHLLWKIPNVVTNGKLGAIACPPQLIVTPPTDHTLHLLHYEADQLCVWNPGEYQLDQLQIRYTYVSTEGPAYKEHFGAKEHKYSHWLSLNHTAGWDLARFLFVNPEAASSAKRDAAGPCVTTTHDFMDLPPHSCFLTWEWIPVWAKGYNCLFLYVAWPYPPRADPLGHPAAPLVFGSTNGLSGGCQWVPRPSGTSIESTAYPIRLEERHGSACVLLQSPEGTPCERSVSGCPHRTRVCCDPRKENGKQALETSCPFRDWVCMASPRHCMGLL